ncbi:MAG: hypothetical protein R3229_09115 [Alphaproteobacteria bacterium]|nr:hypothetical protein [Alphaproteobacteria bacterium]
MAQFVTLLVAVVLGNVLSQMLFAAVGDEAFGKFCKSSLRYAVIAGSVLAIATLLALTIFLFDKEVGLAVFGKDALNVFESLAVGW